MKKILCAMLVVILCLSAAAMAETNAKVVPSKTTGDLIRFVMKAENMPADANFFITPINALNAEQKEEYQRMVELCNEEIAKLAAAENVVEYFGEVTNMSGIVLPAPGEVKVDDAGEKVPTLNEMVDVETEELTVYEYCPIVAGGYEEPYGMVTMQMFFSTPYEVGEKVAVLIGFVTENEDGTRTINWIAYEGIGIEIVENAENPEEQGCVEVKLDPATIMAIQENNALLSIVSAEHEIVA